MAFTEEVLPVERYWPLHFYHSAGILANSYIDESIYLSTSKKWRIYDIRIHFSIELASANDFMINFSSILGSAFNTKILSQAILSVQDIFIHYSNHLQMNSGDHINFTTSTFSIANYVGIEVWGWAVVG